MKLGAYRPEMKLVLVDGAAVNDDIVEVHHKKFAGEGPENFVHEAHKCAWSIGETEWHDEPFIQSLACLEGRLPLVTFPDTNLMITVSEVQLGEDRGSSELIQKIVDAGNRKAIAHRDTVDGPVVDAKTSGAVLLRREESGNDAWALALVDETATQKIFNLLLTLRTLCRIEPVVRQVRQSGPRNDVYEVLDGSARW